MLYAQLGCLCGYRSIQIMGFRGMAALASSHVNSLGVSHSLPMHHSCSLILNKMLAQSRQVLARDTSSGTVHRRWSQGRWSENLGDVRPTKLNLKPSSSTASLPLLINLRNGIDLHTLHRDITADAMCVVCGVLSTAQLP